MPAEAWLSAAGASGLAGLRIAALSGTGGAAVGKISCSSSDEG